MIVLWQHFNLFYNLIIHIQDQTLYPKIKDGFNLDIKMNPEVRLKEYQLNKYGKCFQCGADIIKDCKAICMNCGYKDT